MNTHNSLAPIVTLKNIHKSFAAVPVIRGMDLQLNSGELVTLLGVNGAGKTTSINIILGLEKPDSGTVELFGKPPNALAARQYIGVTPQNTAFPEGIKVHEILEFVQAHYPQPLTSAEIAHKFLLQDILTRQTVELSGGQKRRLAVALAFIGRARCVFLDEPTTGLDVESRQQIWQAIRVYLAEGGTVFLTTHYLEEAESLSTRVIILEKGCIKTQGTVAEIKSLAGMAHIRFYAATVPANLRFVEKWQREGDLFTLHTHHVDECVRELVQRQVAFKQLQIIESSLESAFLHMTGESA